VEFIFSAAAMVLAMMAFDGDLPRGTAAGARLRTVLQEHAATLPAWLGDVLS